jgi:hypothetical protein
MRPSLRSIALTLAGFATALGSGCASPGSQSIVGPDGSPMAHVHCGAEQGVCFRIAGELCPRGYEMKPVLRGDDGNFLVRCRNANVTTSVAVTCPLPVATSAPPALMYPWPAPEVGAAAQRTTTPTPATSTEIDLGY